MKCNKCSSVINKWINKNKQTPGFKTVEWFDFTTIERKRLCEIDCGQFFFGTNESVPVHAFHEEQEVEEKTKQDTTQTHMKKQKWSACKTFPDIYDFCRKFLFCLCKSLIAVRYYHSLVILSCLRNMCTLMSTMRFEAIFFRNSCRRSDLLQSGRKTSKSNMFSSESIALRRRCDTLYTHLLSLFIFKYHFLFCFARNAN